MFDGITLSADNGLIIFRLEGIPQISCKVGLQFVQKQKLFPVFPGVRPSIQLTFPKIILENGEFKDIGIIQQEISLS